MKNRGVFAAKVAAAAAVIPALIYAFSGGPPPRRTGAPGDGLCTQCHTGTANSGSGKVEVTFPGGLSYTPGVRQEWTVTVSDPQAQRYGFQLTARLASNESGGQAGNLNALEGDSSVKVLCDDGRLKGAEGCAAQAAVQFIEHASAGPGNTFRFTWTPPAVGAGNVRVYVAGNAANGNGTSSGDQIYTANYTLTPASAQPQPPAIRAQDGAVNGASFRPGIASGSWMTIFGANLAPATRTWRQEEIVGGKLPAQLDGVSVLVNNKPAAVYYISPTQINAQVPSDLATGPVQVQVTTAAGTSAAVTAQMQTFAPGLFLFEPENRKYVAGVHADGTYLGKLGLFQGLTLRPARPGDVVLLFGTGFGPTDPAVPAGQVFSGAAPLSNPVKILIGGVEAEVQFAGLSGAGLYQFNVKIPATLPDGDTAVVAEVGGVRTQDGATITVTR